MTRACGSCQWWLGRKPLPGGLCRGGPPTVVIAECGRAESRWPTTAPDDWCGAFRLAERMAGGISDADFDAAGKRMAERLATVGKGTPQ